MIHTWINGIDLHSDGLTFIFKVIIINHNVPINKVNGSGPCPGRSTNLRDGL